jgi:Arc/MetJ family transcription regulator
MLLVQEESLTLYTKKIESIHIRIREGGFAMRTNIELDDELLSKAMRGSGLRTKRAVVQAALQLFVEIQSQAGIRKLRGKVQWDGDLNESRLGRHAE